MRKIALLILIVWYTLQSCGIKTKVGTSYDYRIVKIDSIENTYLIYAERINVSIKNTEIIKIVSAKPKMQCEKNNLIVLNKNYKLNTHSLYPENLASHNLRGITYNGSLIFFDKDYNVKKDLFVTENLKGLCYKKF